MPSSAHGGIGVFCAAALALGACSMPATRPAAPAPAATPSPPVPSRQRAAAPAKGPVVLGSRGFEQGKRRIKAALAQDPATALPSDEVGYYIDVLQGRLKQVAGTQVGVVVGRQGNDVILDLSSRLDFAAGSARVTPAIRAMLAPIAKVLAEYRLLLVSVKASPDDAGAAAAALRLSEQRGVAVARYLASAGVSVPRIVVAGSSAAQPSETGTPAEVRTHLEIHLEPIVRTAGAADAAKSKSR